jgi:hypothetical protein
MAFSSRDWSLDSRDAWMYGINSFAEMRLKYQWDGRTAIRLLNLRDEYSELKNNPTRILKDHEIRELVNTVTKVGKEFGHTQQLRERMCRAVIEYLEAINK